MEKRIQGFENYAITDDGRVISYNNYSHHEPRELCYWICNSGYKMVCLCKNNKRYKFTVHKLVAEHFVSGYFDGAVVDHIDANKLNNNACNLRWITSRDNTVKGYVDTGLDQFRHYNMWIIVYPNGNYSPQLKGLSAIKNYVQDNNLPCSVNSMMRYYKNDNFTSQGYKLIKVS